MRVHVYPRNGEVKGWFLKVMAAGLAAEREVEKKVCQTFVYLVRVGDLPLKTIDRLSREL